MFLSKKGLFKVPRQIYLIANFSNKVESNVVEKSKICPYFFSKLLGMSSVKTRHFLDQYPGLVYIDKTDIISSFETLKSFNYSLPDIQSRPIILSVNSLTLMNRYNVLMECGCSQIPISVLTKYLAVMNRTIENLKLHSIIPPKINVKEKLESCFDINVKLEKEVDDNISLKVLRQTVLNVYLQKKLNVSDSDLVKYWKSYGRLKHRNYASICEMIEILQKELNFSNERIIKNGFLLYGEPNNARRLLQEIKTIGGEDFKKILYRRPKIIMSSCDSVLKTIKHVKDYGIDEIAIVKCLEILTLGADTVRERLEKLENIEEFRVLKSNPRVLRLVHYQNKARYRLDFLNQLKVRCASLDILSCDTDKFERFAREGIDRNKGRDIIVFLSKIFKKSGTEIRKFLSRHPNWCHVPVLDLQSCYDYLISKRFSPEDIFHNMYLLLYSIKQIEEKLNLLQENKIYNDFRIDVDFLKISNRKILTLCLYLIEFDYHFSGNGIWTEQNLQQVENFNAILPDFIDAFPKSYRFGNQPSSQKQVGL